MIEKQPLVKQLVNLINIRENTRLEALRNTNRTRIVEIGQKLADLRQVMISLGFSRDEFPGLYR